MTAHAKRHPVEAAYPLSPLQYGMLFHSVADRQHDPYLRQDRYVLEGVLDTEALAGAWRAAAAAHPVLRTGVLWQGLDSPLQVVARAATIEMGVEDLRGGEGVRRTTRVDELAARDLSLGFDLARPPLVRVTLARVDDAEHAMLVTFHHIVLDGWSLPIVVGDVFLAYSQLLAGAEPALAARRPFKDFIAWLGRQSLEDAYRHWERRLDGLRESTPLPGRLVGSGQERRRELAVELDESETSRVVAFTRRERVTVATQLHGAWALALGGHADRDDVVFGTTVSGRPDDLDGVEEMTGLFINTLPTRVALPADAPSAAWLRGLQAALADDRRYGYVALGEIARRVALPPGSRLIESLVVFENAPDILPPELERYRDVMRVTVARGTETSSLPLVLVGLPDERLRLELHVDADQVDEQTAAHLLERVRATLLEFADRPGATLGELLVRAPSTARAEAPVDSAPVLHVEPRNHVERLLADAFRRTLGLERVGVHDDFFELGGDSLLSLRLVARARESGLALELRDVLKRPTVAELAPVCRVVDGGFDRAADGDEHVPLSPMQLRYLDHAGRDPALFDQIEGLEFDVELDPDVVEAALRAVAARHPALRSRFLRENGGWRQRILPAGDDAAPFTTARLSDLAPDEAVSTATELVKGLRSTTDLGTRPPWSTLLLLLPGGRSRIVVAVNHLVFDPYSWGVLLTDVVRAVFLGLAAIESQTPPPFAVWSRHVDSLVQGAAGDEAVRYWTRELEHARGDCPVDFEHGENDVGASAGIEMTLPEEASAQLMRESGRRTDGAGVDAMLAAALARAYARWAGTPGTYLFVESSGRDVVPAGVDMSRTVGWFTCLAPVWIPVGEDEPPAETVGRVRQILVRMRPYKHSWDLLRAPGRASDGVAGLPEPAIALNYLGQADREGHAPPSGVSITPLYGPTADWDVLEGRIDPTLGREVLFDVEAVMADGQLSAHFIYSTNRHRRESVAALAETFRDELLAALPKLETVA
jgi:NRPS condensation-like uncharacterized protein/aryl carrier-like protein